MATTQQYTVALSIYYVFLIIIVTLVSITGQTSGFQTTTKNFNDLNSNVSSIDTGITSFSIVSTGKDLFSFFVWDFNVYDADDTLMKYFWIFKLLFVKLPAIALVLMLVFLARGI